MRFGKKVLLAAGLAATMALSACGGGGGTTDTTQERDDVTGVINGTLSSDGPAEDGGILTLTDSSDAPNLDVQAQGSFATHSALSGIVYSKLLDYETNRETVYGAQKLKGDLAEKWSMSEDGKAWTFNLRQGVKWQNVAPVNGREFTSADVACTLDRINNLPGVQKNLMGTVTKLETPDPYTAIFHLSGAFAAFDQSIASYNMEIIPCEGARGEFDMKTTAIGTGPFILQKWENKIQRTYVKNPNYFIAGKPHLDGVNVLIMSDPAANIAAYRTKQLDVISVSNQLMSTVLQSNPEALVRSQMQLTMTQIMMNQSVKPFDDIRVRKAVAMAWDRKSMGEANYQDFALGTGYPSTLQGGMTPEESDKALPFDPEGAKKLLAEAGYPNGIDVELTVTDGYGPDIVNQAQWVQQDLKKAGINATLKQIDYATYFATVLTNKASYSLAYGYASGLASPDEWLQSYYLSNSSRNSFKISDPELDKMIAEQRTILDKDERTKKLHDIATYISTDVVNPVLGMQYSALSFVQPWVHNLYSSPAYARPYVADVWLSADAPGRKK